MGLIVTIILDVASLCVRLGFTIPTQSLMKWLCYHNRRILIRLIFFSIQNYIYNAFWLSLRFLSLPSVNLFYRSYYGLHFVPRLFGSQIFHRSTNVFIKNNFRLRKGDPGNFWRRKSGVRGRTEYVSEVRRKNESICSFLFLAHLFEQRDFLFGKLELITKAAKNAIESRWWHLR